MTDNPRISIITPVYNGADFIVETVDSVLAQDLGDVEYIVVNDGSTDGTAGLLAPYAETGRIRLITQQNQGEPTAVNRGIAEAAAPLIAVVNADDPVRPGWLAGTVPVIEANLALAAVYPDWEKIDADGNLIENVTTFEYDYSILLEQFLCLPGPGTVFRKAFIDGALPRDPAYRYVGDFNFWLHLGLKGPMQRVPKMLAQWRYHEQGATQHRNARMADEYIQVMDRFFSSGVLPPDLQCKRRQAMSTAYFYASLFGLYDRTIPARFYLLKSYLLSWTWPGRFLPVRRRQWKIALLILGLPLSAPLYQRYKTWKRHS